MNKASIRSSERRWLWKSAIFVLLMTSIPYVIAFYSQGSDWVFTGSLFGVEDGNSYIAKMLSGYNGEWLFKTPYTTAAQNGAFIFFPYLLLGKLAWSGNLHGSMVILYHLFRVVAGFYACLVTHDFISLYVQQIIYRKLAWIVAILGGGMGWAVVLLWGQVFGSLPLEFYSPETFGFLSIYGIPHLAAARALLLYGLINYLRGNGKRAGLSWLALGLFQPVAVVVGWVVIGAHMIVIEMMARSARFKNRDEQTRTVESYLPSGFWSIVISAPIVIYSTVIFVVDPFLRAWKWSGQNLILSPHPIHYVIAYGLLIPYVYKGMKTIMRLRDRDGLLLLAWIVIFPALVYAPVDFQRRLAEGVWVAIVIMATLYFDSREAGQGGSSKLTYAPYLLTLPSTLFLIFGGSLAAFNPTTPIFLPTDQVAVYQYLNQFAEQDAVVMGSFETGNALPAWAPLRVVLGHGPESVDFELVAANVVQFYNEDTEEEMRIDIISEYNIRYILWGPDEFSLGSWNPSDASYLELIYKQGEYQLYEVSQ